MINPKLTPEQKVMLQDMLDCYYYDAIRDTEENGKIEKNYDALSKILKAVHLGDE
ncbi:hypothetical protein UFOVP139_14 [uncultured Caudovirales phage]|uniref:Uncharacterized protein n=1 Tax=uncultured Caudovirales phage TaxID=2100421 RepID=A0A6J5LKS0_9CAUD|nr:hypothetical protein UFOVP139_14 [uncultured Caudovirales phage]